VIIREDHSIDLEPTRAQNSSDGLQVGDKRARGIAVQFMFHKAH
jgi:hypothetical protein